MYYFDFFKLFCLNTQDQVWNLILACPHWHKGFPDSSVCKEFACNAGDPGSILELRRSPGEGIGYPFQYSWAFLVAQLIKNWPAMWETWVRSHDWEDALEKGKATHSSISGLENSMESMGSQRVRHYCRVINIVVAQGIGWTRRKETKEWPISGAVRKHTIFIQVHCLILA